MPHFGYNSPRMLIRFYVGFGPEIEVNDAGALTNGGEPPAMSRQGEGLSPSERMVP